MSVVPNVPLNVLLQSERTLLIVELKAAVGGLLRPVEHLGDAFVSQQLLIEGENKNKKKTIQIHISRTFTHSQNATQAMHTFTNEARCGRLSLLGPYWVVFVLGSSTERRRLRTHVTADALILLQSKMNPVDLGASDQPLIAPDNDF